MKDFKSKGVELIAQERARQINEEGWTPKHDDGHVGCELAAAAAYYAYPHKHLNLGGVAEVDVPRMLFPQGWDTKWMKRRDDFYARNLVKAGALIAAELDRLDRLGVAK